MQTNNIKELGIKELETSTYLKTPKELKVELNDLRKKLKGRGIRVVDTLSLIGSRDTAYYVGYIGIPYFKVYIGYNTQELLINWKGFKSWLFNLLPLKWMNDVPVKVYFTKYRAVVQNLTNSKFVEYHSKKGTLEFLPEKGD